MNSDRFLDKVAKTWKCWNWLCCKDYNGYGKFRYNGESGLAHRFSYELFRGKIPDNMTVDHLCRNRKCVNPEHLELVTLRENILRGKSASALNAKKTHCPKGHEYCGDNLYVLKGARFCKICSKDRGIKFRNKLLESKIGVIR